MKTPSPHAAARALIQLCTLRSLYSASTQPAFSFPYHSAFVRPIRPPPTVSPVAWSVCACRGVERGHDAGYFAVRGRQQQQALTTLSGGGKDREGSSSSSSSSATAAAGGGGSMMADGEDVDLEQMDFSEEELAVLERMFKESTRTRRKTLRKQNSEIRARVEKKGGKPAQQKQQVAKPVAGPPTATNEEEALAQAKAYRKVEAPKRLVELSEQCLAGGFMTDRVLKAAVRSEVEMGREDLALAILDTCQQRWPLEGGACVKGRVEAVRWYCRLGQTDVARDVARSMGLVDSSEVTKEEAQQLGTIGPMGVSLEDAGTVLTTLGKAALKVNDTASAVRDLRHMVQRLGCVPSLEHCNSILHALSKRGGQSQQHADRLFTTLDLMREADVHPDSDSYQHLANALVRSVEFVTGAVSMNTLPAKQLSEAVFIGRSNVGKSSLLNMVCARKDLAYVSKRPGKTQQFNYFVVNDNTRNAFYLVDVPGVGFAKVSLDQKAKWAAFFQEYVSGRAGLRVIFHLIDSRHGPLEQDLATMDALQVGLREGVRYVVVLTKADKKDGKVSPTVMQDVQSALEARGLQGSPVLVTSSVNKMGRDAMWRYLRLAVLDNGPSEK